MGVPVTTLANTMQMSNVMNGVHTIDTGMLVLPVIMEMIMLLGDSAGVKYDSGLEDPNKISTTNKTRESLLAKAAMEYKGVLEEADLEAIAEEEVEEEEETQPSGLMARRN
jgi:hypothetical protein